jgi:hypothetical protein
MDLKEHKKEEKEGGFELPSQAETREVLWRHDGLRFPHTPLGILRWKRKNWNTRSLDLENPTSMIFFNLDPNIKVFYSLE